MREVLRAVVQNLCQKLPGMTDPLSTQLPPSGNVPPSKKLKLDSVSDGAGEPCWRFARRVGQKGCKPFAGRRAFPDWGLPNCPRLLSYFMRATAVVRSALGWVLSLLARGVNLEEGVSRVCLGYVQRKACYTASKPFRGHYVTQTLLPNTVFCLCMSTLEPSSPLTLPLLLCNISTSLFTFPDFLLEDLPDDLLVTSIDLPALDGPSTAEFTNMPGLSSNPAQQPLPGLNSSLANSQPRPAASMSPMSQTLAQPATSVNAAAPNPPPSSTPVGMQNSSPCVGTSAGASPNTTVISTSADPTPSLPNISSTSATQYPANAAVAAPVPHAAVMATNPRMPPASTTFPYNSYAGMTSSAPSINSQMNPMQPQQPQQQHMMNFVGGGGGGGLRHPSASPNMSRMPMNMAQQHTMMSQQQGMMQVRQRPMMHSAHGHPMMTGHPQQSMAMHMPMNRVQQMNPGMNMGGGMGPGGIPMHPNIHMTTFNPRTGLMEHTMVSKHGMHHHRMPGVPHQMQHPVIHTSGMNPVRQQIQGQVMVPQHQFSATPSGYHGQMRSSYTMPMNQNAAMLPPHSNPGSSQMLSQQQQGMQLATSTIPQNMPSQQQQPRPPSEGVGQGSPLPGQLPGGPGPQLQVATPPQQQATPPQQQAQAITVSLCTCTCVLTCVAILNFLYSNHHHLLLQDLPLHSSNINS